MTISLERATAETVMIGGQPATLDADRAALRLALRDAHDLIVSRWQSFPKEMTPAGLELVTRVLRRLGDRFATREL